MLGKEVEGFVACDKFQPTVLEGQMCYSLDLSKVENVKRTKNGKKNSLTLVLDLNIDFEQSQELAMFYVHTLSPFIGYRNSSYAISFLKKMTGTKSFLSTPDNVKKCQLGSMEDCNTRKYLGMVQHDHQCILWALDNTEKVCIK